MVLKASFARAIPVPWPKADVATTMHVNAKRKLLVAFGLNGLKEGLYWIVFVPNFLEACFKVLLVNGEIREFIIWCPW